MDGAFSGLVELGMWKWRNAVKGVGRAANLEGSDWVEKYWDDYYGKVGTQGDYIDDLIESAKRRPYGRNGNLSVVEGEAGSYFKGKITYNSGTKRWEFIEGFLHYNVDKNNSLQNMRKAFRSQLKESGIQGQLGRVAEEMAVKTWLLNYADL